MLSTQVPGIKLNPKACEAPRTDGIFSVAIKIYGLVSPSILICLVPVTASAKLTSIDGLVSKLSERLQQAAFSNSSLLMVNVLAACKYDLTVACFLEVKVTSSKLSVGCNQCCTILGSVIVNVSVLKPT